MKKDRNLYNYVWIIALLALALAVTAISLFLTQKDSNSIIDIILFVGALLLTIFDITLVSVAKRREHQKGEEKKDEANKEENVEKEIETNKEEKGENDSERK